MERDDHENGFTTSVISIAFKWDSCTLSSRARDWYSCRSELSDGIAPSNLQWRRLRNIQAL